MNKVVKKSLYENLSEYIFAIMPMIISGIILITKNSCSEIYFTKDWSFISILLIGQVITKFNAKMIPYGAKVVVESMVLTNAILICMIFIPIVIVFCCITLTNPVPHWLYHIQAVLFIISTLSFVIFSILPELISEA